MIPLEPVDAVEITVLVDNLTDPFVLDSPGVRRTSWPKMLVGAVPRLASAVTPELGRTDMPIAEPGFSALVRVWRGGRERTVLFDTGVSADGMVENMRRLDLDPGRIEVVVLSHGHWDHIAGLEGLVRRLGRRELPVVLHPEFFARRRISLPGCDAAELPFASRGALTGLGCAIVEERRPSFLLDGGLLVTGEVDRTTDFERGFPGHEAWRHGGWQPDPLILDDQAIVLRLRDRGLVVLTGCGHSGIVNIVRHVQQLTGETRIAAVLGGFHLGGAAFEPIIDPTVDALAAVDPGLLMPGHCTGWKALSQIATRLPDVYVPSCVGTTVTLGDPSRVTAARG